MNYAIISGDSIVKYPVNIREEYPNTSFPAIIEDTCLPDGVVPVLPVNEPDLTYTQYAVEIDPVFDGEHWKQTWDVQAKPGEETAAYLEATWAQLRYDRDQLLSASDWTQLPDSPLDDAGKASYVVYRQALRDFPDSIDSPFDPSWPSVPA